MSNLFNKIAGLKQIALKESDVLLPYDMYQHAYHRYLQYGGKDLVEFLQRSYHFSPREIVPLKSLLLKNANLLRSRTSKTAISHIIPFLLSSQ